MELLAGVSCGKCRFRAVGWVPTLTSLGRCRVSRGLEMLGRKSCVISSVCNKTWSFYNSPVSGHCSELATESCGLLLTKSISEFLRFQHHLESVRFSVQFPVACGWVKSAQGPLSPTATPAGSHSILSVFTSLHCKFKYYFRPQSNCVSLIPRCFSLLLKLRAPFASCISRVESNVPPHPALTSLDWD